MAQRIKSSSPTVAEKASVESSPADDELISDTELAARWHCSVKTLRNHRSAEAGCPFVRLGGLVRYRLSDVILYERAGTKQPASGGQPQ